MPNLHFDCGTDVLLKWQVFLHRLFNSAKGGINAFTQQLQLYTLILGLRWVSAGIICLALVQHYVFMLNFEQEQSSPNLAMSRRLKWDICQIYTAKVAQKRF